MQALFWKQGWTPLHHAIISSKDEIVSKLLNRESDPNVKDADVSFEVTIVTSIFEQFFVYNDSTTFGFIFCFKCISYNNQILKFHMCVVFDIKLDFRNSLKSIDF